MQGAIDRGLSAVRVNATSLAVTRARAVVVGPVRTRTQPSSERVRLDWNTQLDHDPHLTRAKTRAQPSRFSYLPYASY